MTDQELTKKINSKIEMLKLTIDDLPRTFITEKPIEGSYKNRYFHRKQSRTNSGPETPSSRSHVSG